MSPIFDEEPHFNGISAIMNFARDEGWITGNPLSGRNLARELPQVEKNARAMMSPAEINKVLTSEAFVGEREKGPRGQARFWIPLLCLFHGFRSNEACQLLVSDIQEEEGIWFFTLDRVNEEGEQVKRFKTSSSIRRVPIHNEPLAMGFIAYVEEMRERGETWLSPALSENSHGSRADAIGKWFGRLRKRLLPDLPDQIGAKGLHSFRHSFERELRDQGVPDSTQYFLCGWSDKKPQNASVLYGDGYGIRALKKAVDRVEYPGVDLSALYVHSGG